MLLSVDSIDDHFCVLLQLTGSVDSKGTGIGITSCRYISLQFAVAVVGISNFNNIASDSSRSLT